MGKRLTDDELTIMLESETLPLAVLAKMMGKPVTTMWYARNRLRTGKWLCEVRYDPCHWCGQIVTIRATPKTQRYRKDCARKANAANLRRRDVARPKDPHKLERLRIRTQELQQQTMVTAVRMSAKWTAEKDAVVKEMLHLPIVQAALRLGRTRSSVATRRATLRRSGDI
jgi:hypothetical protein